MQKLADCDDGSYEPEAPHPAQHRLDLAQFGPFTELARANTVLPQLLAIGKDAEASVQRPQPSAQLSIRDELKRIHEPRVTAKHVDQRFEQPFGTIGREKHPIMPLPPRAIVREHEYRSTTYLQNAEYLSKDALGVLSVLKHIR